MASLTETAQVTRSLAKIGLFIFIGLVILFYVGVYVSKTFFSNQAQQVPPNLSFGILPQPDFPKNQVQLPQMTLEPIKSPVSFPPVFTVRKLALPQVAFADKTAAIAKAVDLGFPQTPSQSTENTVNFVDAQIPSRTLEVTLFGENFIMQYDYRKDPSVFTSTDQLQPSDYINRANDFFKGNASLPSDLTANGPMPENLSYDTSSGQLVPLTDPSQNPDAVRVNYFPQNVDNLPIYYDVPGESPNYAIVTANDDPTKQIIEAQQYYFSIDQTTSATYPMITYLQAFQELQAGQGYIAQTDNSSSVTINEVMEAYYEHGTDYVYPVYVFTGENFTAYVLAVRSDEVSSAPANQAQTQPQTQENAPTSFQGQQSAVAPPISTPAANPQPTGLNGIAVPNQNDATLLNKKK